MQLLAGTPYVGMNQYSDIDRYPRVDIKKGHERRILRGHPWVFSNELAAGLTGFEPGQLVRVYVEKGRFVGIGYINPHSLIAVRLLRRTRGTIDKEFLQAKLNAAIELRHRVYPDEEAVRLVFSESDCLPGLLVDRYGDHLVVQITTAGMEELFPLIRPLLEEKLNPACIVARNDVHFRKLEGLDQKVEVLLGDPDPGLTVTYEGLKLAVDLMGGQKTGLFLDQRENQRTLLSGLARGEVLDCFCYQGVWGLLALQAGAEKVTGVDSSQNALDYAAQNALANDMAERTEWIKGDVIDLLKGFRSSGKVFDVVVLDPPSYAKNRKHVKAGLRGYLDLNRKAMEVVAPGGILITCSCSYHVDLETFTDTVGHAAGLVSRHVRVLGRGGQSRDHHPLITAPETDYLKCLALQID